jgi:2-Cys peroxiredoxin 5
MVGSRPLPLPRPELTFISQVKQGDSIPNVDLFEDSPGNKVNLSKELATGKGVIIGVPAAFSPSCSDTHIPGYIASDKLKSAGKVFVVSVNDAFV